MAFFLLAETSCSKLSSRNHLHFHSEPNMMAINTARLLSLDSSPLPATRFTSMFINRTGGDNPNTEHNAIQLGSTQSTAPMSSFNRLPSELVMDICNRLSPSELWFNARPISRQFYSCANEVLLRKCFYQEQVRFSWCCFWCSLGHSSLDAAARTIASLFGDARNVRIQCISDQVLLAKLAFGELCSTIVRAEQKIYVSIGNESDEVVMTAVEWQRRMERVPKNLQQRRHAFLALYFARLGKKAKTWRITASLSSVAHVLGFIVLGVIITVVIAVTLLVFCIAWETFRVVKSLWGLLDRLIEVCLPDRLLQD